MRDLPLEALDRTQQGDTATRQDALLATAARVAWLTNAGAELGGWLARSWFFDAQTGEYGNLVTKGIIDPTKVVRCAIQAPASVAGLLITTEAMVAELRFARWRRDRPRVCRITNITLE